MNAVGYSDRLDLRGPDEVADLAKHYSMALRQGRLHFKLSDGSTLEGKIDEKHMQDPRVVGRCLDLASAYKQLPLHPRDRCCAVLSVFNLEKDQCELYISNVLPFGATGSVVGFNRVARALQKLLIKLIGVTCTNYFDDYP